MVRSALYRTARRLKQEVAFYRLLMAHERTPPLAKWLLGGALAYALSPIDIIPDWIPLLGHLDDLIIVPLLVILAVRLISAEVIAECRLQTVPPDSRSETSGQSDAVSASR